MKRHVNETARGKRLIGGDRGGLGKLIRFHREWG